MRNVYFSGVSRPRKRLTELLTTTALDPPTEEQAKRWENAQKTFEPIFLKVPASFLPSSSEPGRVGSIRLITTKLQGEISENQIAELTDKSQDISCGLVLRSIGYKSLPADPEIPFDSKKGVIKNVNGRVMGMPGIYIFIYLNCIYCESVNTMYIFVSIVKCYCLCYNFTIY